MTTAFICLVLVALACLSDGNGSFISSRYLSSPYALVVLASAPPGSVSERSQVSREKNIFHYSATYENPVRAREGRDRQQPESGLGGGGASSEVRPDGAADVLLAQKRRRELFDEYKALLDQELARLRAAEAKEGRKRHGRRHEDSEEVVAESEEELLYRRRIKTGGRYSFLSRSIPLFSSERRTRTASTTTTRRLKRKGMPLWLKIMGGVTGAILVAGLGYLGYRLYKEDQEDVIPYDPWYPSPSPAELYLLRQQRERARPERQPVDVEPGVLALLFQEAAEGTGPPVNVLPPGTFSSIRVPARPLSPAQQKEIRERALRKADLEAPAGMLQPIFPGRPYRDVMDISPRFDVSASTPVVKVGGKPSRVPASSPVQPGAGSTTDLALPPSAAPPGGSGVHGPAASLPSVQPSVPGVPSATPRPSTVQPSAGGVSSLSPSLPTFQPGAPGAPGGEQGVAAVSLSPSAGALPSSSTGLTAPLGSPVSQRTGRQSSRHPGGTSSAPGSPRSSPVQRRRKRPSSSSGGS